METKSKSFFKSGLFFLALLTVNQVFAEEATISIPTTVNGGSGADVSVVPSAGSVTRTGNKEITVRLINNCFATNLRSAGNPVSPDGIITASLTLQSGTTSVKLMVKYPGFVTALGGMTAANATAMNAANYTIPNGGRAAIYGNTIEMKVPVQFQATVNPDGSVITDVNGQVALTSSTFGQTMLSCVGGPVYGSYGYSSYTPSYPCGTYMGRTGPLAVSVSPAVVSADRTMVELSMSVPGQTGFCGGYWSPLMVMWGKNSPEFTGISNFPLSPGSATAWPEKNAKASFIAFDRNKNGKIDAKDELFGDTDKAKNGFEALREFDSNKDGVIDSKDKDFDKLVLWQDKNGDGISESSEMLLLGEKLASVSLKYKGKRVRAIGLYAEEREKSTAVSLDNPKKIFDVVDIWLSPRPQLLTGAENKLQDKVSDASH